MARRRVLVPALAAGLVLLMGSTALAQPAVRLPQAQDSKFIEDRVEVSVRREDGGLSTQATKYTKTVTITRSFKSLAGLTVAKHYSRTTWTYGGGTLYSSPRGIDVDWWTAPLNNYKTHSAKWDWYTTGKGGTGRSNTQVQFVFGVPTPWGPVGSSYSSRIYTTVNGNGGYSYF
ncbi:hypothetical protein [Symbiobacterium thermophilum]|nr:hypothetical protein [Symbiobacterium thermophilum]MBY6277503.1 hypothetical protein [Symbiobacterium thermophilum]OTA42165.1 MAG: hypothetical protein A6D92_01120 [Symbiobacterium thermophilum]